MSWRSGFGLIPGPAKILAALAFVVFFFGVSAGVSGERLRGP